MNRIDEVFNNIQINMKTAKRANTMETNIVTESTIEQKAQPSSVTEMRKLFESAISESNSCSSEINKKMKIADLGESEEMIAEAISTIISTVDRSEESNWKTKLRNLIPFGVMEKAESRANKAIIRGSSSYEVTEKLIGALEQKRKTVEGLIEGMFDLYEKIEKSYQTNEAIRLALKEKLENNEFELVNKYHAEVLFADVLAYGDTLASNKLDAMSTIETASVTIQQIAGSIPKLRSQLSDGMTIAATLNQLNLLTETSKAIDEVCTSLSETNRVNVNKAQITAIEAYTVSDTALKAIESNHAKALQHQEDLASRRKTMHSSLSKKIDTLEKIGENSRMAIESRSNSELQHLKNLLSGSNR